MNSQTHLRTNPFTHTHTFKRELDKKTHTLTMRI